LALSVLPGSASATKTLTWYENGLKTLVGRSIPVTIYGHLNFQSEEQGPVECNNVFQATVVNESEKGARGQFEGWGVNACKAPGLESVFREFGLPTTVYATAEEPLIRNPLEGEICNTAAAASGRIKLSQCPSERETRVLISPVGLARRTASFPWKTELSERIESSGEHAVIDRIGLSQGGRTCYPVETVDEEGEVTELASPYTAVPAGCLKITVIAPQIPDEIVFYGSIAPVLHNGAGSAVDPSFLEFNDAGGELVCGECHERLPETPVSGELRMMGAEGQQLMLAKSVNSGG
jgi:hypothetical protein